MVLPSHILYQAIDLSDKYLHVYKCTALKDRIFQRLLLFQTLGHTFLLLDFQLAETEMFQFKPHGFTNKQDVMSC